MTINFYLDTRPQGDKPILIYVILSRNVRLKFNTGEKIPSEHWDFKKHLAKRSYVGHAELNSFLTNLKEKLLAKLRLLYAENDFVSADMVRETVNKFLEGKKNQPIQKKYSLRHSINSLKLISIRLDIEQFKSIKLFCST